jgi:hypothetical protein
MAKQSLGRDLGALMGKNPKEGNAPLSDGVRSLMRGNNPPAPPPPAASKPLIPRWYLFAADIVLVSVALVTLCLSHRPLSLSRAIFCTALVVVAGGLAVVALLTPGGKSGEPH